MADTPSQETTPTKCSGGGAKKERLEVPSVTTLERKLLSATQPRLLEKPTIFSPSTSSVLSRVRDFLPALQTANAKLEAQLRAGQADAVNIEHIEGGEDAPRIEMDLACGILDLNDQAAVVAAEQALLPADSAERSSQSESDCDSDWESPDTDQPEASASGRAVESSQQQWQKAKPKKKKARIVEI